MNYCSEYIAPKPVGKVYLIYSDKHLYALSKTKLSLPSIDNQVSQQVCAELDQYFAGSLEKFTIPLKLEGTDFQVRCWKELQRIKYGKTISYKEEALKLGGANYSRAVAGANNKNKLPIIIPCHRVVGSDGSLTGYAWGLKVKQYLLDLEAKKNGINKERESS